MAALLVTDIVSQTSLLVLAAPESFHNLISYPEIEEGIYKLEGVVSRKKQLLPFLTHSLAQLK
jgi:manganese-dependent inorganic pyrophosphatase